MVFTSATFIFVFLPISVLTFIIVNFLCNKIHLFKILRLKEIYLIGLSLLFYAWNCFDHVLWLIFYSFIIYILGILLSKSRNYYINTPIYNSKNKSQLTLQLNFILLVITIIFPVIILSRYKYADLFNNIFYFTKIHFKKGFFPMAPLGISFIVFSSISYLVDIKQGNSKSGNFIDCTLYITFFPKVVSGPIMLWRNFATQIENLGTDINKTANGFNRICIGLAKKVLLADFFGQTISLIENNSYQGMDFGTLIITFLLYMLQIYYDFSGYSDIAIGLLNISGMECSENFNFPYRSKSISEFWRRWHISLGTWFKEYIYIPLGGNRKGIKRTLFNLGIVFFLTGLWHGAHWNYILWGCLNGLFVIIERCIRDKSFYKNTPEWVKWIITMMLILFSWIVFRVNSIHDLKYFLQSLSLQEIPYTWKYYLDNKVLTLMFLGFIGATLLGSEKLKQFVNKHTNQTTFIIIKEIVYILLLILSLCAVVSSTYKPFIYFQY